MKRPKPKCGCDRQDLCVRARLLYNRVRADYRRTADPEGRERAWWAFDAHVLAANGK